MADKLTNKQYKDYDYLSRYTSFPFYYNEGDRKYIYGVTSQLNQSITYVLHEIKVNETLDTLALDYYNNPTFFWIIADFNHIQDPFLKLEIGSKLKIPTLNEVNFGE